MIIGGIDYSMSCPCVCVHTGSVWNHDNCEFMFITKEKKFQSSFLKNRIIGKEPLEYTTDTERFAGLARVMIDYLAEVGCEDVMIEGYAMGAKGMVFNIGENTGILKFNLMNDLVNFEVEAPSAFKKFATGKGNADKDMMYAAFISETGIDLKKELDYNKKTIGNPIGDIVDSYFICKYLFNKRIK